MRFAVLTVPRTGSNWLCSLLDSHPQVLCYHELFNPERVIYAVSCRDGGLDLGSVEFRDRDPLAFLERAWAAAERPWVGFKLNRGQEPRVFEAVLPDPGIRKVVLRRENRVKTFVSEKIAEATRLWESYPWSRRMPGEPTITVRPDELVRHVARNAAYFRGLYRALEGEEFCEVTYEGLVAGTAAPEVLRFLGVPDPDRELVGATRKMNPTDLRLRIENFDELAARLEQPELRRELLSRAP